MSTTPKRPAKKSAEKRFRATVKAHVTAKNKRETALVRLSPALKKRLNMKLAEEGRKFQEVAEELITRYVDGDVQSASELDLQVQAARASMRKNAVALRELAK
jgi:hypothetical protein